MPREPIQLSENLEKLSVLAPDGVVDEALAPDLTNADVLELYRAMLLGRRWDEKMIVLSRQGRIAVYPPASGQEAASIGPVFAMNKDDWLVPSFREVPALLYRGWPKDKLILGWWGGNEYGAVPPDGQNMLPLCGVVAGQCPYAVGIAWGEKLRKSGRVVVCFVGDGGTSEGDFHEAMNVAGAFHLPLVMVVQNNHWAISMPRHRQTRSHTIAQKAVAYGFGGLVVDGNDVLAMIVAAREALATARGGGGPTLIEAITYRLGQHSTADHAERYRSQEEVDKWLPLDPLTRFEKYVRARGLIDDAMHTVMEAAVEQEIASAIAQAEEFEADLAAPFHHCFAQMPAALALQAQEFARDRDRAQRAELQDVAYARAAATNHAPLNQP